MFHFIFRPTNIYKEPAVYEVQRALPVITELRTRIKELLLEWPDHPGLKQVLSDVYCPVIAHFNASQFLQTSMYKLDVLMEHSLACVHTTLFTRCSMCTSPHVI